MERVEYIALLAVYIPQEHYNVNALYCTVTTLLFKMLGLREGGMCPEHKCSSGTLSLLFCLLHQRHAAEELPFPLLNLYFIHEISISLSP